MRRRVVPSLALVAAVVALAGCGGASDAESVPKSEPSTAAQATTTAPTTGTETKPKPKPTRITIRVVGGRPQGGIARPSLKKNSRVVLIVRSDIADEVHLHGYDISRPVTAGGRARLAFVAKIPGRFELELEERGIQLAELTVR